MRMKLTASICLLLVCGIVSAQDADWQVVARLGMGEAKNAAWHPDEDIFAVVSATGVRLYDLTLREQSHIPLDGTDAAAWHPSGDYLAVAGVSSVTIWQVSDLTQPVLAAEIPRAGSPVAWSPDGTRLAYGMGGVVRVWDWVTERSPVVFGGHVTARLRQYGSPDVFDIIWSADGETIVSINDSKLAVWDAATGALIQEINGDFYQDAISLLRVGAQVWMLNEGHRIVIENDTLLNQPSPELEWEAAQYSPDQTWLATVTFQQQAILYRVTPNAFVEVDRQHFSGDNTVETYERGSFSAWNADGSYLLTGTEATVVLWRIQADKLQRVGMLAAYNGELTAFDFSPDGQQLAAGYSRWNIMTYGDDSHMRVWDVGTQTLVWRAEHNIIHTFDVAWHSGGRYIATSHGDDNCVVRIWDHERQTLVDCLPSTAYSTVEWQPNGTSLAVIWGYLYLFDDFAIPDEDTIQPYEFPSGDTIQPISALDWHPDGTAIVSDGYPGHEASVVIWRVADGRLLLELEDANAYTRDSRRGVSGALQVKFSPDGRWIAIAEGHARISSSRSYSTTIAIYDAATGKRTATLRGHKRGIVGLAWSPDGEQLASASLDGTVRLWHIAQPENTAVIYDTDELLAGVAWSPVGDVIAVGTQRGIIYLLRQQ